MGSVIESCLSPANIPANVTATFVVLAYTGNKSLVKKPGFTVDCRSRNAANGNKEGHVVDEKGVLVPVFTRAVMRGHSVADSLSLSNINSASGTHERSETGSTDSLLASLTAGSSKSFSVDAYNVMSDADQMNAQHEHANKLKVKNSYVLPSILPSHSISHIKNQIIKSRRRASTMPPSSNQMLESSVSEPLDYAEERVKILARTANLLGFAGGVHAPSEESISLQGTTTPAGNIGSSASTEVASGSRAIAAEQLLLANNPSFALVASTSTMTQDSQPSNAETPLAVKDDREDTAGTSVAQGEPNTGAKDGNAENQPFPDVAGIFSPLINVTSRKKKVFFTHYFIRRVSPNFYVAAILEEENDMMARIARMALRRETLHPATISACKKVIEKLSDAMSTESVWRLPSHCGISEVHRGDEHSRRDEVDNEQETKLNERRNLEDEPVGGFLGDALELSAEAYFLGNIEM